MQETCVETSQQVRERHHNWVQEMRDRQPNENEVQTILNLKGQGWKAPAIASGLELNLKTVRKLIRRRESGS
jgi:DNA-binding NarL/FixJ family response regulator